MNIRASTIALLVVAAVFGLVAFQNGPSSPDTSASARVTASPVLSARRAPGLLIQASSDAALVQQLDGVVEDGPSATCVVVDVDGRRVFTNKSNLPVVPASNMKLLTAQIALDTLGADYRFTTRVVGGALQGDTVAGDLTLVGGGDPMLGTKDYADHFAQRPSVVTPLESLADAVAKSGVKHVTGSIIGDESRYDSLRAVPSWPSRYVDQNQVGPLSALLVNGALTSFPETLTEENRTNVEVAADPPRFAAATLGTLLEQRGVQIDGPPGVGKAPNGDRTIATVTSKPLSDIAHHMLTESDNQVAEMFVKELGHHGGAKGTTANGVAVLRSQLSKLGVPASGVVIRDGSGLDEGNRVTCAMISKLLDDAGLDSPVGHGLAIAGKTGTLRERFVDPPVAGKIRAKTGTLNEVSALSGFASSTSSMTLTFSYIATGAIVGPNLLSLQDRLGAALVGYGNGLKLSTLGPK